MKLNWFAALMMVGAMTCAASENECVVVRMQGSIEVPHKTVMAAELLNMEIFRAIGVSMNWKEVGRGKTDPACGEIHMEFQSNTPQSLLPGALAYATPYQVNGTRIRIFTDRVLGGQRTGGAAAARLAFVMAHEIGHVLQGVSRHSEEGIMQAHTPAAHMLASERMRFSKIDATLIHTGLRRLTGNSGLSTALPRRSASSRPIRGR